MFRKALATAALTPVGVGLLLGGQTPFNRADFRAYAYSPAFEEVDFSEIEARARQRDLKVDGELLSDLVRRNFSYLFWNCLDQKRFLAPPPPKRVAQSMLQVLDLNQRLTSLLVEARHVASAPSWSHGGRLESDGKRLMREVGEAARDLKDAFQGSFVEAHKARYKLAVPSAGDARGRFLAFLVQAERINRSLTGKVDDYFFSADPGAVEVADFDQASVVVLAEALSKLCDMSAKAGRR